MSSSTVADRYFDFLIDEGYKLTRSENGRVFRIGFKGDTLDLQCAVYIEELYVAFHAILPIAVPPEKFGEVLSICNGLNMIRPLGNFELHTRTQKILFKIGMETPPFPSNEYFEQTLMLAVTNANMEAKAFLKVLA